ncbi:hypothetical protein C8F01DRAFT_1245553 [Mycena amicta]|nr:hypothetical protein C8F01DRAFT_1245553 [Mycena amicta]
MSPLCWSVVAIHSKDEHEQTVATSRWRALEEDLIEIAMTEQDFAEIAAAVGANVIEAINEDPFLAGTSSSQSTQVRNPHLCQEAKTNGVGPSLSSSDIPGANRSPRTFPEKLGLLLSPPRISYIPLSSSMNGLMAIANAQRRRTVTYLRI